MIKAILDEKSTCVRRMLGKTSTSPPKHQQREQSTPIIKQHRLIKCCTSTCTCTLSYKASPNHLYTFIHSFTTFAFFSLSFFS